jgi:uncharacterized protein
MENLLSPMLLAFALGVVAARLKSDLKFPEGFYTAMTMYLLAAIGMKGGYKLSATPLSEVALPAVTAFLISCLIPLWTFWILKRAGKPWLFMTAYTWTMKASCRACLPSWRFRQF